MPIAYAVDDDRRYLMLTATGIVTRDEAIAAIDRQIADGLWAYGLLYDIRAATELPKPSEIFDILEYVRRQLGQHGPRGPVAIVAAPSRNAERVRMYSSLAEFRQTIATFKDVDEASRWLTTHIEPGHKR